MTERFPDYKVGDVVKKARDPRIYRRIHKVQNTPEFSGRGISYFYQDSYGFYGSCGHEHMRAWINK